jgi:hypothetical protein
MTTQYSAVVVQFGMDLVGQLGHNLVNSKLLVLNQGYVGHWRGIGEGVVGRAMKRVERVVMVIMVIDYQLNDRKRFVNAGQVGIVLFVGGENW